MFPRLNERGSIEARPRYWLIVSCYRFPRLNERGSIEAKDASNYIQWDSTFPRLNERGSIEAARDSPIGIVFFVSTFE